jgi:aspartate carbamoyltransferase regulatory subunit
MTDKMLKVQKIEEGTVIDHIAAGKGWEVVKLLGLENYGETVTLLSNVYSKSFGKKDIVKIEKMQIGKNEISKIALVSPRSSVNLIKNFEVKSKYDVELPKEVEGILKCTNPVCVTLVEPVAGKFTVESKDPLTLRCVYCERVQSGVQFK